MKCISPMSIADKFAGYRTIPCGKCLPCLQRKRADWSFRLRQEWRTSLTALFVTLTYDEQNLTINGDGDGTLLKRDFQLFMKRLRKLEKNLRYYAVGEYGSKTDRPHYHIILFNCLDAENLDQAWQMGIVDIGTVTDASIHYVTKYCITHETEVIDKVQTFALMSRKPGLGSKYLDIATDYHRQGKNFHVTLEGGMKQALPRYYKDKIFEKGEASAHRKSLEKVFDQLDQEYLDKLARDGDDYGLHKLYEHQAFENQLQHLTKNGTL